jgi:hypothetical protein
MPCHNFADSLYIEAFCCVLYIAIFNKQVDVDISFIPLTTYEAVIM